MTAGDLGRNVTRTGGAVSKRRVGSARRVSSAMPVKHREVMESPLIWEMRLQLAM